MGAVKSFIIFHFTHQRTQAKQGRGRGRGRGRAAVLRALRQAGTASLDPEHTWMNLGNVRERYKAADLLYSAS